MQLIKIKLYICIINNNQKEKIMTTNNTINGQIEYIQTNSIIKNQNIIIRILDADNSNKVARVALSISVEYKMKNTIDIYNEILKVNELNNEFLTFVNSKNNHLFN